MPFKPGPFQHPSSAPIPRSNSTPIGSVSSLSLASGVPHRESAIVEKVNPCDTANQKAADCATSSSVATRKLPGAPRGSQIKKRGPFKDQGQRQQTGLVRSLGACIRCSMQRIRCKLDDSNPNGCCLTCAEATKTRAHWVPCLRYKITDAELLDHELCPRTAWTVRWKKMEMTEISTWASDQIKTISCTQDVMGTKFELKVRKFAPVAGDALARKWKRDGVERTYDCPPYAIASMKDAAKVMARFVDRTLSSSIFFYVDETDKLLRDTYTMAYRQSKIAEVGPRHDAREEERKLLLAVLRLWAASRLACRSDRICGTETLGMEPQDYGSGDANSGILLTPPVFSAQLEVIITATLLVPAKREVLSLLRELLQGNERRSWFAIYLAMFILLHNCALLTQSDNKKARKQGLESRFFRTALVESLHHGAKILLAYFHYCNKGSHPFKMDWSEPDQVKCMEMDEEQIHFMQQTTKEINGKSEMFQRIREEGLYEHEYHFISQLYDVNWKPVHTV
ncbi:hypothetical protein GQ53DRAFT_647975 [Thozetella sp. PMI_491]|nr:hypothetical protein GQ53DRAFT_647975 [Thozetella sp. PMI_491]